MIPKTRRLQIDLNRRTAEGYSPASYHGPTPRIGEPVTVFEPEDSVRADGHVVRVDNNRCLAYVDVDWGSIRDDAFVDVRSGADSSAATGHIVNELLTSGSSHGTGGLNLLVVVR